MIDDLEAFEINHVSAGEEPRGRPACEPGDGPRRRDACLTQWGLGEPAAREVNGVVRNGVVEFMGPPLPNGTFVKVRAAKP